ncbi:MAG: hypothetical protein CMJ82_06105 [Planctomycetaceae bacterium]|nr:hypothetical protein [Planctomycetaceae bacterium]
MTPGKKLQKDLIAGLVVFLVALPLCLGIALASDAPLASGLLAGIIGGLVVGSISGSSTSVSGPAAGLTAIVSAQIFALGNSFEAFVTAVFLAGIIQIAMGCMKAGALTAFFPSSVIKGLLAAIGTILILKQLIYFFGGDRENFETSFDIPGLDILKDTYTIFEGNLQPGPLFVGILCISLLIIWPRISFLKKTPLPPALAAVVLGVILQFAMSSMGEGWAITEDQRVNVPSLFDNSATEGAGEATAEIAANSDKEDGKQEKWFTFPGFLSGDFSVLAGIQVYIAAITIAIVASLETLLNLEAVDKLDPKKRPSPPSRELVAQGVGNCVGGLIGSLPVTSVIIRSSVNIHVGAETKKSTIFHGILLVLSVAVFATYLNYIPFTSLAAILLMTGWKLANPKLFRSLWKMGARQFAPFLITLVAIVFTDLLLGVIIGMVVSLLFVKVSTAAKPFTSDESVDNDGTTRLVLAEHVSFLSRFTIKKKLATIAPNSTVVFDGTGNGFIDEDALEMIADYIKESAKEGITASAEGLDLPEESAGLH